MRDTGKIVEWRKAMLDPDIRRLLDTVFNVAPGAGAPDVAQLRAAAEKTPALLGGAPLAVDSIVDAHIPGNTAAVAVRIYRPAAAAPLPLVLYAHGGGWVTGSLETHDRLCRILASRLHAVVVAVDYRCAPEHVFPAALDDVALAWQWARANAGKLGADGTRFAVAGDSSGGNLAAGLTLRLREYGAPQPQLQLLLYPALDATCSRRSYREFATGYNLSAEQMAWYWNAYRSGVAADTPWLSPLVAASVDGLAPAVVAIAEHDVLRDDGLEYAQRLEAAGVPVQLIRCDGMIHGFLRWGGVVPAASRWIDTIAAAGRAALGARV
jgi:acetyl esterase/lipase